MEEEKIWLEILAMQLDGVMHHVVFFEQFSYHNIQGFADLHKHHSKEEFDKYLHVYGDIVEHYKKIPDAPVIKQPVIELHGATMEEKVMSGLELYEQWEKMVYKALINYLDELSETKEHLCYLIDSVKQELKYINCMKNDILDGKCEELNCWLIKNMGNE